MTTAPTPASPLAVEDLQSSQRAHMLARNTGGHIVATREVTMTRAPLSGPPAATLGEVLAHATGRRSREDPVARVTGGPAGNALLTAWIGVVLLGLFVAELLTLFDVQGLISWHVAIGALLVPPALAKSGSTGWRIVRYYGGHRDYVAAGPPPLPLRVLGPLVVASTLGLLGTGVALVLLGATTSQVEAVTVAGIRIDWVTLHQAAFVAWAVVTGLHVLARLLPALRLVRGRPGRRVPGSAWRLTVVAVAGALAVLVAVLLVRVDGTWRADRTGTGAGTVHLHASTGAAGTRRAATSSLVGGSDGI